VSIEDISFFVAFGTPGQSSLYGVAPQTPVIVRKTDGALVPDPQPRIGTGNNQGRPLQYSALADFSNVDEGLNKLMTLYCAGRGSWNSGSDAVITTNCPATGATVCPTRTLQSGSGTKYDYQHLWAAEELAARKSALGATRTATLRERLKCGVSDPNQCFSGFALMILGYLGEDAGARRFIQGKIDAGGDMGTIAKAALLLMGGADDKNKYKADVTSGLGSSNVFVSAACAASLGIADLDDATVSSVLVPKARWVEPDTSDNGKAFYASHLLALVAWDRRGWVEKAQDSGPVTFYEGGVPVRPTVTATSTSTAGGTGATGTASATTTGGTGTATRTTTGGTGTATRTATGGTGTASGTTTGGTGTASGTTTGGTGTGAGTRTVTVTVTATSPTGTTIATKTKTASSSSTGTGAGTGSGTVDTGGGVSGGTGSAGGCACAYLPPGGAAPFGLLLLAATALALRRRQR
jgi:hypothetical protein